MTSFSSTLNELQGLPASQPAQLNSYTESEGARRKGNVPPREQRNWLEVRSAIKSALSLDHVQFPCERTSIMLTIHAVIGYNKHQFNCRSIGSLILSTANCYIIIFLLDVNKFVNEKKKARQPLLVFIISRQGQGHDESPSPAVWLGIQSLEDASLATVS